MIQWLLVFCGIFLADVFWVLCIRRVQTGNSLMAGVWAVAIFLPTAFVTVAYVGNYWLFIPACLGHFLGTACTVWWEQERQRMKEFDELVGRWTFKD